MLLETYENETALCKAFFKTVCEYKSKGLIINPKSFKIWHNDNGQRAGKDKLARIIAGRRAKEMGVEKGRLDYDVLYRTIDNIPFLAMMEFKMEGGTLTPEQEDIIAWCHQEGIPVGVYYGTFIPALRDMQSWGIIKKEIVI